MEAIEKQSKSLKDAYLSKNKLESVKEFQQKLQDKIHISAETHNKKQVLVGSIKPHAGHTCFQLNLVSMEITEASFERVDIQDSKDIKGSTYLRKKLVVQPNCIYATALNKVNAIKKFAKLLASMSGTNVPNL